jgi:hypothetical protein
MTCSTVLSALCAFRLAKLNIARGLIVLEADKRFLLLNDEFSPADDDERWGDVAAYEIVGPGYTPGGLELAVTAGTFDGDAAILALSGAAEWPGSTLSAKWLVVTHPSGEETVSSDLLLGYADLNPGAGSVTTRAAMFRAAFASDRLLLLS